MTRAKAEVFLMNGRYAQRIFRRQRMMRKLRNAVSAGCAILALGSAAKLLTIE